MRMNKMAGLRDWLKSKKETQDLWGHNFLKDEPVIFRGCKMRIIEHRQWYEGNEMRATLELVEKKP